MTLAAATRNEGILGLEARMLWRGILWMNDLSAGAFPRVKIDRIVGLHARGERTVESEPKRGQIGEQHYPAMPRGKTVVYEGRAQARTLPDLRVMERAMRGAFNDSTNQLWTMAHRPPAARGGVGWFYNAYVLDFGMDDEQANDDRAPIPWQRPFSLSLRMEDPRFFSEDLVVSPSQGPGGTYAVDHAGGAPTDPVFRLTAPLSDTVTLNRAGATLVLHGDALTDVAGQLIVDFAAREARVNDDPANDLSNLVTFGSTWWDDGVDGIPAFSITDVSVAGCTSWEVLFRHADW